MKFSVAQSDICKLALLCLLLFSYFLSSIPVLAGYGGEQASTIHFIWVGEPLTKKEQFLAKMGPTSLITAALKKKDIYPIPKVLFWVREYSMNTFRMIFQDFHEIEIRSIDSLLKREYQDQKNLSNEDLRSIKLFIDKMDNAINEGDSKWGKPNIRVTRAQTDFRFL